MSLLDSITLKDNVDGSQDVTLDAQSTFHVDPNVHISKQGNTLEVDVTYKLKVAFFNVTRKSKFFYNPSTGSFKVVA